MKTIGIIGGLGPMATVCYLEHIMGLTDVDSDQRHPRIFMESIPDIPDRTAYILGESQNNPLDLMVQAGKSLAAQGADFITIPCVTAHYFYPQLVKALDIPVVNLPEEIAHSIVKAGVKTVGILATKGTNRSGVLEKALRAEGIDALLPDTEEQEILMEIIYQQVKGGQPIQWEQFYRVAAAMRERGADKLILGCTELPLLKRNRHQTSNADVCRILEEDCVDVLEVLARCAVERSGAPLKES